MCEAKTGDTGAEDPTLLQVLSAMKESFENAPAFGSIGLHVFFVDSRIVRIEKIQAESFKTP